MKNKIAFVLAFICVLSAAFFCGRYSTKKERSQHISNLIAARDSIKHYIIEVNSLELRVSEKGAIILTQHQAIQAGIIEREYLKKLHIKDLITNTELSGIIERQDSLLSLPPKTEYITVKDTSGITKNYVRYPFQLLSLHDEYLNLDAGMDANRKAWYDLTVPFSGNIAVAYQKDGFMKAKPVGIFTSSNQYLNVKDMNVLIVKDSQKWYQKTWVHMLAGGLIVETAHQLAK